MAKYMASRIMAKTNPLEYDYVISCRPDLKEDIDLYLIAAGREDLITKAPSEAEPLSK